MAGCGRGAATGKDHRVFGRKHAFSLELLVGGVCAEAA